jgi:hypothetical protein
MQRDVRGVFRLLGPSRADRNASPVHFRSCVVIRPTTRHTDDPSKVTCGVCKGNPAFIKARDEMRRSDARSRLLAEKELLTDIVKRTTRAVELQTERLHRAAQRLSTALDDEKAARGQLAEWERRQESAVSPSGSTESVETAGSVPEPGPYGWMNSRTAQAFPTAQRAAQGLTPVDRDADAYLFGVRKYAPGPF